MGTKIKYSIIGIFVFIIVLFLLRGINANFVCGEVLDSKDNVSASWYNVRIFYPYNSSKFVSCDVSPAGNKYCCDTEAIPGKNWNPGDTIGAEIFDDSTGYVAGPVYVVSSGRGYTIFPQMQLEKVIKVYNPYEKIIYSNISRFFLNFSVLNPYNHIESEKDGNKELLCDSCSHYSKYYNASFGMNHIKIYASNLSRVFFEDVNFAIINHFDFYRNFLCDKCNKNKIKANQIIDIKIGLNLSHEIKGFILKEYVPISFEILDPFDGEVSSFSETHNIITWNVSGKNVSKTYKIKAPDRSFLNSRFLFKTELENLNISEEYVTLQGFIPFFPIDQKSLISKTTNVRTKIFKDKPFVLKPKNDFVYRIGVFPNETIDRAEFILLKTRPNQKLDNIIDYYFFKTNIPENKISKILVDLNIDKKTLSKKGYDSIDVYSLVDGGFLQTDFEKTGEDNKSTYYSFESVSKRGFAIVGVKEKSNWFI